MHFRHVSVQLHEAFNVGGQTHAHRRIEIRKKCVRVQLENNVQGAAPRDCSERRVTAS